LQTLTARGSLNGWDFSVKVGTALAPEQKNLIDSYGKIPLQKIQDMVEHEIQGHPTPADGQHDALLHLGIID
jgi:hypothetical protein